MKSSRSIIHCIFFLLSFSFLAQSPEGVNYQAMYRNGLGDALPHRKINVLIEIYQGSQNGILVYREKHKTATNGQGLFNIIVGNGYSINEFADIDWSIGPYFMHTEIFDLNLNQNIDFGVQQLMSVPYALYAKTSGNSVSGQQDQRVNKDRKEYRVPKVFKVPKETKVHREIKVPKELKVPREIKVYRGIKVPKEPKVHREIKVCKEYRVHKEPKVYRGDQGPQGTQGPQGDQGLQGILVPKEPKVYREIKAHLGL